MILMLGSRTAILFIGASLPQRKNGVRRFKIGKPFKGDFVKHEILASAFAKVVGIDFGFASHD